MYMQNDLIDVKVSGCAGTVILKRPDHNNCLTRQMIGQITEALDDLYREKSVRAIIITGAGDSFCQGVDLNEMADEEPETAALHWGERAAEFRDLLLRMLEITKPIIAAVNGPALSGGAGLATAADIVVASNEATFGLPDPRFGLIAGVEAPLICYRIGTGPGSHLLLTSKTIDAIEAHRLGLFHEIVDTNQVWAKAVELAEQCALGAPESIQLTKRHLYETIGEQLETQLTSGAIMRATSCTTQSAQEGLKATQEDRDPVWE